MRDRDGCAPAAGSAEARPEHVPRSRPPSPRKRPHAEAGPAEPSADGLWADAQATDKLRAEVRQLRAALGEAQQQLRDVRAQMEEAVGQRDGVTTQAEAAARDATRLLQVMAWRAAQPPPGHGADASHPVGVDAISPAAAFQARAMLADAEGLLQPSSQSQAADPVNSPSTADRDRLKQQLQVLMMAGSCCRWNIYLRCGNGSCVTAWRLADCDT